MFQEPLSYDLSCCYKALHYILQCRHIGKEIIVLENKACLFPQFPYILLGDGLQIIGNSVKDESASVCLLQEVQTSKKGGLT